MKMGCSARVKRSLPIFDQGPRHNNKTHQLQVLKICCRPGPRTSWSTAIAETGSTGTACSTLPPRQEGVLCPEILHGNLPASLVYVDAVTGPTAAAATAATMSALTTVSARCSSACTERCGCPFAACSTCRTASPDTAGSPLDLPHHRHRRNRGYGHET